SKGLKILVSPVRFLVAPQKKKSKSRKPLKVNDFQGFLFSSKSQKRAKSHICGGGIGDFFKRLKKVTGRYFTF
ncbi:MAG: hypothetical protein LUF04_07700, partial [Bacteroides sp.]|nr:hypothetical protein [Bacteroides sp.]